MNRSRHAKHSLSVGISFLNGTSVDLFPFSFFGSITRSTTICTDFCSGGGAMYPSRIKSTSHGNLFPGITGVRRHGEEGAKYMDTENVGHLILRDI